MYPAKNQSSFTKEEEETATSLVQALRLQVSTAGGAGLIPGKGTRILCAMRAAKKKEGESGCWEVTGSLSFGSSLLLWSSAFPLFHVVSASLANGLVIQASRALVFPKN